MDWIETLIVAIVEGLTEFLPVSSTGHMIIAQNLLGVPQGDPFVHAFTFIIQFGAILSVVCLYWKKFFQFDHSPVPAGSSMWQKLKHKYYFYWLLVWPARLAARQCRGGGRHAGSGWYLYVVLRQAL